jgi:nucleoside-diphosphate-sugar epimerase
MRVLVAGASGTIGMRLVPRLIERGHHVVATTTSLEKRERLRWLGAEAVLLDGLDAAAVGETVARAEPDVIAHEMTALAGRGNLRKRDQAFAITNRLRTCGIEYLLTAAEALGVKRLVAQSYTGWTNIQAGSRVKNEDDPFEPRPAKGQAATLAAIRYLETAVVTAPLDGIALRYGTFYGPGVCDDLLDAVRRRRIPIIGDGSGVWSWIHIDDAAAATVAAIERGRRGVYNVVDDHPAAVSEWLPFLADLLGAKPPLVLPRRLGRPLVGEAMARCMTVSRGAANAKARRELDWRPAWSSWREGFRYGLSVRESGRGARRAAARVTRATVLPS